MENLLQTKSYAFAKRIVKAYSYLTTEKGEYILSKQMLRSGTSIGANIRESRNAQSRADFANKLQIALKEADETAYWIDLIFDSGFIDDKIYKSMQADINELISILTSSIKTVKYNGRKQLDTD